MTFVILYFSFQRDKVEKLLKEGDPSHVIICDHLKKVYRGKGFANIKQLDEDKLLDIWNVLMFVIVAIQKGSKHPKSQCKFFKLIYKCKVLMKFYSLSSLSRQSKY